MPADGWEHFDGAVCAVDDAFVRDAFDARAGNDPGHSVAMKALSVTRP